MTINKPILTLSVPRSTSTALERAFIQRTNCVCFHEPFGEPYYYGPERLSTRYTDAQREQSGHAHTTYQNRIDEIKGKAAEDPTRLVFIKDMASCELNLWLLWLWWLLVSSDILVDLVKPEMMAFAGINPTVLSDEQLGEFRYAFLVRSPRKAITSYYRAILDNDCGDFGDFDPDEAGFAELLAMVHLYNDCRIALIDSDDLVNAPEDTLRAFCTSLGIPFEENMLHWKAQRIGEFDKWKGFHEDAQNSTGFKPVKRDSIELPKEVEDAIQHNEPIYNELLTYALK
ncbi:hypothetical protein E3P77_01688 [Wallemia ichthyophaga]|uniref:Branched-chain-amino-acid aminotransferase-like protein 2 n=1 Tax=Wallemia ichthyophaga TaxID=245174 RepID=A0A4T0IYY5_WALIC|nr:hypothetical protein E3P98_01864 [Wallemia ichthyophaga]TIA91189.1 hypothetical protein E3P97_02174 [Wallemia ichthyophaga]TIB02569.1 hypothetical protein E3P96_02075 [Wallemia ichthyophaga]TIB12561.1 hypothetical protein E3P90_02028 [Wallemia ichthyophaga]TIB14110.1 hypothetical protein E3P93_01778 [Wallemia ichthyophaga]